MQQALPKGHRIAPNTYDALQDLQRTQLLDGLFAVFTVRVDGNESDDDISWFFARIHERLSRAASSSRSAASMMPDWRGSMCFLLLDTAAQF